MSSANAALWGVDLALRATLILALACLIVALLARASAALRHVAWTATVAALLALPVLVYAMPAWRALPRWEKARPAPTAVPALTSAPTTPPAAVPAAPMPRTFAAAAPASMDAPLPAAVMADPPAAVSRPAPAPAEIAAPAWPAWVLAAWLAGAAALLSPLAVAAFALLRLRVDARPCILPLAQQILAECRDEFAIRRPVALLESPDATPMTFGILHPQILVPADSAVWSAARWRIVLRHELAHIQRHDLLTQTLAQLMRAIYWFHPLAWFACARMATERERACDDLALAGTEPAAYAAELFAVARAARPTTLPQRLVTAAVVPMARFSSLESRVRAVLDAKRNRRRLTGTLLLASLLAQIAIVLPIATLRAAIPSSSNPVPATHTLSANVPPLFADSMAAAPISLSAPAKSTSPESREALEAMASQSDAVLKALADLVDLRPRTPEFLMLRLEWRRKSLNDKLLLATNAAERKSLLEGFAKDCEADVGAVRSRMDLDATSAEIGEARFALALAADLHAIEAGDANGSHAALLSMAAEAKATCQGIVSIEKIRRRSPDFTTLTMEWSRRRLDLDLELATTPAHRKQLIGESLAVVKAAAERPYADNEILHRFCWDYAAASLELLQANEAGAENDAQAAAQKMLAAARRVNETLDGTLNQRSPTPELVAVRLKWREKLLDAELVLARDDQSKAKALADYTAACRTIAKDVNLRAPIDATTAAIAMAHFAVTEAEYLEAAVTTSSPTTTLPATAPSTPTPASRAAVDPDQLPTASILGQVTHTGVYNLTSTLSTVGDLVTVAGLTTTDIDQTISLYRLDPKGAAVVVWTKPLRQVMGTPLQNKDLLMVGEIHSLPDPALVAIQEAEVEIAKHRAEGTIEIDAEKAVLASKQSDLARLQAASVSALELEQARLEVTIATARVHLAESEHEQNALLYKQALAKLQAVKNGVPLAAINPSAGQPDSRGQTSAEDEAALALAKHRADDMTTVDAEKAIVAQAQVVYERAKAAQGVGRSTPAEFDQATAELENAKARLAIATAQHEEEMLKYKLLLQQVQARRPVSPSATQPASVTPNN